MNRTAHPLFSPLGCLGGGLLILGILIAVLLSGGAIFSPGALTVYAEGQPLKGFASHAEFENDCTQCHEAGVGITAERCEVCHTVQANERRTATGLHGKLDAAQAVHHFIQLALLPGEVAIRKGQRRNDVAGVFAATKGKGPGSPLS